MSYELHSIGKIRAAQEGTFGADVSASIGSMIDVPAIEGTAQLTLTRDEVDPMFMVQHSDEARVRALGKRKATLTFSANITPGTVGTNGVNSAAPAWASTLLGTIMGGTLGAEGSVAAAGSTATVINVSGGDGDHWATPGQIMGWLGPAGVIEWREVESRSTDAITLKRAFSGAPSAADPLYNKTMFHFTENPVDSLSVLVEGAEETDRWLLVGGQAEGGLQISIDATAAALPRLTFTLGFANWYAAGETSSPITGPLTAASYGTYTPVLGERGRYDVWVAGTSTYAQADELEVSAVTWEPSLAYVPITANTSNSVNTILCWRKNHATAGRVTGSFTLPYQDTTWFAARNAATTYGVMQSLGIGAASTSIIISAPSVQMLNPQRVADASGLAAQTIQWVGRRDTDVGAATADASKSPLRIFL